jgi:hypothetical protein
VIINATSTLLPSIGTLSDFKLSIQAPKTFVVTPTAFSGTVIAAQTYLVALFLTLYSYLATRELQKAHLSTGVASR